MEMESEKNTLPTTHSTGCWCEEPVMIRIRELYNELLAHGGFGELRLDVRILKRRQREIVITCGKQYRYVVDMPPADEDGEPDKTEVAGGGRQGNKRTNSKRKHGKQRS